jgi:phosphatidylethanolamine-binding protein (PEBP) family uncharacterized protein
MALALISKAFAQVQPIPDKYTRQGDNLLPPLAWSGAPDESGNFALVVEGLDAPSGTFRHCGIANIPAQWTALRESANTAPERPLRFYKNDFGDARYDSPPPPGDRPHHDIFCLAALNVPKLSMPDEQRQKNIRWQKRALQARLPGKPGICTLRRKTMAHAGKKRIGRGAQGRGDASGARSMLDDSRVEKNAVLSNTYKVQPSKERGLDSQNVETEKYHDHPGSRYLVP